MRRDFALTFGSAPHESAETGEDRAHCDTQLLNILRIARGWEYASNTREMGKYSEYSEYAILVRTNQLDRRTLRHILNIAHSQLWLCAICNSHFCAEPYLKSNIFRPSHIYFIHLRFPHRCAARLHIGSCILKLHTDLGHILRHRHCSSERCD